MADNKPKRNKRDEQTYDENSDSGSVGGQASTGDSYTDLEDSDYNSDDFYADDTTS